MTQSSAKRVQRHRDELRAAGLRPIQIWVPDTRRAGFDAECRRQSERAARADQADTATGDFLDAALSDVAGWKE